MHSVKEKTFGLQQYLIIALTVLLSCFILFSIDKDTHTITDLFKPVNLVALVIYFTPTFAISLFLFLLFSKKPGRSNSLVLSLVIGIPLSFILVIGLLLLLKP